VLAKKVTVTLFAIKSTQGLIQWRTGLDPFNILPEDEILEKRMLSR
jgi:hypothetical protein